MATFTIDIPNLRLITDGDTTIQEINDAARDFEDQPEVIAVPLTDPENRDGIVFTSGKDDLGGGVFSPITLRMVNGWRIYHLAEPGPTWKQVNITQGTLIATNTYNDNPVEDSAFVNWTVPVANAGALLNIDDLLRLRQWMTNRQELAEGAVDNFVLYEDDGVTVAEIQAVTDKDGNAIILPEGAPAKRSTSVEQ